jgi:hypothetical protein
MCLEGNTSNVNNYFYVKDIDTTGPIPWLASW